MVMGFTENWHGEPTNFVEHVKSGRKWHSIRHGIRWRPGMQIQMATGVRTRKYRMFMATPCTHVQRITLHPGRDLPRVAVDRGGVFIRLAPFEILSLAINDGFDSATFLNAWIAEACKARKVDAFRGQIVMWHPSTSTVEGGLKYSSNHTPY